MLGASWTVWLRNTGAHDPTFESSKPQIVVLDGQATFQHLQYLPSPFLTLFFGSILLLPDFSFFIENIRLKVSMLLSEIYSVSKTKSTDSGRDNLIYFSATKKAIEWENHSVNSMRFPWSSIRKVSAPEGNLGFYRTMWIENHPEYHGNYMKAIVVLYLIGQWDIEDSNTRETWI